MPRDLEKLRAEKENISQGDHGALAISAICPFSIPGTTSGLLREWPLR